MRAEPMPSVPLRARTVATETGSRWAGRLARLWARRGVRGEARIDAWLTARTRVDLRARWREATERAGFGEKLLTPLGGFGTGGLPLLTHVQPGRGLGDPAYLIVRLRPGQTLAALAEAADELAAGLGCWGVRLRPRGVDHVRVDLIEHDPLAAPVPFLPPHSAGELVFGIDEHAATVTVPLDELTHLTVQGATRSGKSAWTYSLLAQLAARPHVDIAGIDPTGLLLRPFGPHPRGWRVTGTDHPQRYADAIAAVVAEMDRRIAALPPRADTVPLGPACPLLVVVLEEWAAVGRLVGHTRAKPSAVHRSVARLLAEGAKAGIRVVTIVQRAEADVVGAFERDQALTRLSFAVNDINTLKMLHPEVTPEQADVHATSPKGVALLTGPGLPLLRLRGPWIGGYGAYCDHIAATDAACPGTPTHPGWEAAA
ncbi:FtsK/SpoIIIE domain-containing protein [Pseudonocardia hispaniensis]|uniref:FtsK/SpoIIIE domain-containing protein n=1 Tax=Pseudonocardia hispaniensis TaxID=904933 RepID=A0ABW1J1F4_9PSEU